MLTSSCQKKTLDLRLDASRCVCFITDRARSSDSIVERDENVETMEIALSEITWLNDDKLSVTTDYRRIFDGKQAFY